MALWVDQPRAVVLATGQGTPPRVDVDSVSFDDNLNCVAAHLDERSTANRAQIVHNREWPLHYIEKAQVCDLRFLVEPPIGIEPMTYSLRVNRSSRLS